MLPSVLKRRRRNMILERRSEKFKRKERRLRRVYTQDVSSYESEGNQSLDEDGDVEIPKEFLLMSIQSRNIIY